MRHLRIVALRDHQRQLDADGIEVGVSRQALDETLDSYDELLTALKQIAPWLRSGDYDTRGGLIEMDRLASVAETAIAKAIGQDGAA